MRFYSITNMYTSGIHAGIQTAHVIHEMFSYYDSKNIFNAIEYSYPDENSVLHIWAQRHKTIIVLNGGYQSELEKALCEIRFLGQKLKLPVGHFNESKEALNGALTAIGIVVPEHIYAYNEDDERFQDLVLTKEAEQLRQLIKSFSLAK